MQKSQKVLILVEGAIMTALATALSFVTIFKLPWGGSITLLSMLPIALFSIKRGVKSGLAVSFLYSLIQLGQGIIRDGLLGWGLTPGMLIGCILLDYILAFTVLSLSGLFRKTLKGQLAGITLAVALRFACHFLSGVVIFHSFGQLWEGFYTENSWLYSLLYNGAYMLPELIFTAAGAAALLKLPQTRRMLLSNER